MTNTITDQPAPITTARSVPVWPLAIRDMHEIMAPNPVVEVSAEFIAHHASIAALVEADMLERDRIGRERYGTPLMSHNGRKNLVDAYQEVLDGIVYIRAEVESGTDLDLISLASIYQMQMTSAFRLRAMIEMQKNAGS